MKKKILFNNEEAFATKCVGYYVTKSGKVISIKVKGGQGKIDETNPREHNYKKDKDGYLEVLLSNNSKRKYYRIHRLIWETFYGDIPMDLTVDHIDGNKTNNNIENLRLLTREENARIANSNKQSKKAFEYEVNGIIKTRKMIEQEFGISRKFWYNSKNKINEVDYIYKDIIFKRV